MSIGRDSIDPFRAGDKSLSASHQMEPLRMAATKGSTGENEISDATGIARRRRPRGHNRPGYFKIVGYATIPACYSDSTVVQAAIHHVVWAYGKPADNAIAMQTYNNGFGNLWGANDSNADLTAPFIQEINTQFSSGEHPVDNIADFDDKALRSDEFRDCVRIYPVTADGTPISQESFVSSVLPNTTVRASKITSGEAMFMADTTANNLGTEPIQATKAYALADSRNNGGVWRVAGSTSADFLPSLVFLSTRHAVSAVATAPPTSAYRHVVSYYCELTPTTITLAEGVEVLDSPIIVTEATIATPIERRGLVTSTDSHYGPIDGVLWPGLPGFRSKGIAQNVTYASAIGGSTSILLLHGVEVYGTHRLHAKTTAIIADAASGAADLGIYDTGSASYKYYNGSDTVGGVTLPAHAITLHNSSGGQLASDTAIDIWFVPRGLTNVATSVNASQYIYDGH